MNELVKTNGTQISNVGMGFKMDVITKGKHYELTSPINGVKEKLVRDIDFGLPSQKMSKPCLYKPGAEKVCALLNLMPRYDMVSSVENLDGKSGICHYLIKCSLVRGFFQPNGEYHEVVYASGFGSANTSEKRNGFNGVFDAANSTVKMAQKRALVSAALGVSSLSGMFSQDLEDTSNADKEKLIINEDPNAPITQPQIKRLFAIAGNEGVKTNECKELLASLGYASSKDIKQGEYNDVIEKIKELGNK